MNSVVSGRPADSTELGKPLGGCLLPEVLCQINISRSFTLKAKFIPELVLD